MPNKPLHQSQIVNKLVKYLYKNLDGAFKMRIAPNEGDVYLTVLYMLPVYLGKSQKKYDSTVHEMTVDLHITTYADKIRMNIIAMNPQASTIGFDTFPIERMQDMEVAKTLVLNKLHKRLEKEFDDYEFMF